MIPMKTVEPSEVTPEALATLDRDALLELKLRVDEKIQHINGQITEAKSTAYLNGEYADPDWFRRVNEALGHAKRASQRVQMQIGKLKEQRKLANIAATQAERQADTLRWERAFIAEAKSRMSPEDFEYMKQMTDARLAAEVPPKGHATQESTQAP